MDCLNRLMTTGEDDVDYVVSDLTNSDAQSFAGEGMSNDSVFPGTSSDFARKKGCFSCIKTYNNLKEFWGLMWS